MYVNCADFHVFLSDVLVEICSVKLYVVGNINAYDTLPELFPAEIPSQGIAVYVGGTNFFIS